MTTIEETMDRTTKVALVAGAGVVGVVGFALRRERKIAVGAARLEELHSRYSRDGLRCAMDETMGVVGTWRLAEDVAA